MNTATRLVAILVLSTCMIGPEAFAQLEMTDFCFEIENPSNASSIQILDADDNPYLNLTVGTLDFTVEFREDVSDPWTTAGIAQYQMETDGSGYLQNNSGVICADFGGLISDVSQIQISMTVNAAEWNAAGLEPWSLDNVTLLNGSDPLLEWDYTTDGNATYVDPLISSNGGLGDAWSGDLTSPAVTGGVLEFEFPEGGGGGGGFVFDVAAVPEPNSVVFLGCLSLVCLRRRR